MSIKRVFLIVLDSFGIGEMPDADQYGDVGANTFKSISKGINIPNLCSLGLCNIDGVNIDIECENIVGAFGRMTEASKGKDTTIGHWEIGGIISNTAMPTYPNGFPKELLNALSTKIGRGWICNKPYSGTDVIRDFGEEHIKAGAIIVYTSADSVLQIAAHEKVVPIDELYKICQEARELLINEHAVGRVIARPFDGDFPSFFRTKNRHDYSLVPPKDTMLNLIKNKGLDVISVGKINDIFAGSGVTKIVKSSSNQEGMEATAILLEEDFNGLCFTNLVDFDMLFGHRNDIDGYRKAIECFDAWLGENQKKLKSDDVLIITADHGCDPATASTDHSREYTPLLVFGDKIRPINLHTRDSFSDIGSSIVELLGIKSTLDGESFACDILKKEGY